MKWGEFCSIYQDFVLTDVPCKRIEADEIWAFVGAKQANAKRDDQGDIWTYTAICADSKLAVSWLVGMRGGNSAQLFMRDVASRLKNRVQLTTDRFSPYIKAVEEAFGWNGVDYGMIKKTFGMEGGGAHSKVRYSPSSVVIEVEKVVVIGKPDPKLISTSYVERHNLEMRMKMRRFTRLTNGFSKKAENHAHAVSLHFMAYNFCKPHGTLTKAKKGIKTTPAMAAGVTDHVWTVEELLGLMGPNYMIHDRNSAFCNA